MNLLYWDPSHTPLIDTRPMSLPPQDAVPARTTIVAAIVITVLIWLAYSQIQLNGYHFDDWPNILSNPGIQFEHLSIAALQGAARNAYLPGRPFASITFAIDWWRGDGEPAPFLATNLVLHVFAALAVFALLRRALSGIAGNATTITIVSALASLWWAAQPIHVQAVSYIVQRMTELAALFSILAVWAWLKGRTATNRNAPWYLASVAAFGVAILSKENAWITPLLVLMAELLVLRQGSAMPRDRIDRILLALPLIVAILAVADLALDGPVSRWALHGYAGRTFTLMERVLTQPKVVLFHVSQLIWPHPARFSIEHDVKIIQSVTDWQFWFPLGIIIAWTGIACWLAARPKQRVIGFFMLWVPVTLLIESSIVPLELIFEHRMYLPAVGFAGLFAALILRAQDRPPALSRALMTIVALHAAYALWSTHERVPQWRTDAALYESAVRLAPTSSRAWNYLGIALLGQRRSETVPPERYARAMTAFEQAMKLDPAYAGAWVNRGIARYMHGDIDGALFDLRRAIAISPYQASAQHYLAEIYAQVGLPDEARMALQRACALGVKEDCRR